VYVLVEHLGEFLDSIRLRSPIMHLYLYLPPCFRKSHAYTMCSSKCIVPTVGLKWNCFVPTELDLAMTAFLRFIFSSVYVRRDSYHLGKDEVFTIVVSAAWCARGIVNLGRGRLLQT
jgi:hypothetical protein